MANADEILRFKGRPETLVGVRCRGCGRLMGWGTGQPLVRLFCSPECAFDGPLGDNEERNDCIREAVVAGWTTTKAAASWGLTRQRVNQVLNK